MHTPNAQAHEIHQEPPFTAGRIATLDGIRGVAVLLVVLFHFGLFPAGWVGVQFFFVLSGYLITNLLLKAKDTPLTSYLGRFFWRRSLRIFPLYFFFLAAAFAVFAVFGAPTSLLSDWPYLVTYTTNFARLREGDVGRAFVHLWSLAVEEQFYLMWPFAVYFLSSVGLKRCIAAIIFLTPLLRVTIYFALSQQDFDPDLIGRTIYSLPVTQFDAFAFGAGISVWKLEKLDSAGTLFFATGLFAVLVGGTVLFYQHFFQAGAFKASLGYQLYLSAAYGFVWGYSLIDIFAAAGLVCALQKIPALSWLGNPVLTHVGVISYGVYVYHLPILAVIEWLFQDVRAISRGTLFIPYVALVILVSELSFRFLESPFLGNKTSLDRERSVVNSTRD